MLVYSQLVGDPRLRINPDMHEPIVASVVTSRLSMFKKVEGTGVLKLIIGELYLELIARAIFENDPTAVDTVVSEI